MNKKHCYIDGWTKIIEIQLFKNCFLHFSVSSQLFKTIGEIKSKTGINKKVTLRNPVTFTLTTDRCGHACFTSFCVDFVENDEILCRLCRERRDPSQLLCGERVPSSEHSNDAGLSSRVFYSHHSLKRTGPLK